MSDDQGVAGPATVLHPARNYPGADDIVDYAEGIHVGYRYFDALHERPLFPFGYGLTYTSFSFGGAHISSQSASGDRVRVAFTVTNTGNRTGTALPQLYLTDPHAAHEPPYQLKAFRRVTLAAGAKREVTFTVGRDAMSYYRASTGRWEVAAGRYVATIGSSEQSPATKVTWRYAPHRPKRP
jgi:beta-glucosidase